MGSFFTDPVLRAPTLGCLLIGLMAGLIGCLVFLQKRSLVGETVSHAVYPGVVLAVAFSAALFPFSEGMASLAIFIGALVSGLLSIGALSLLE